MEKKNEANLSTEPKKKSQQARISWANEHQKWQNGVEASPSQGTEKAQRQRWIKNMQCIEPA